MRALNHAQGYNRLPRPRPARRARRLDPERRRGPRRQPGPQCREGRGRHGRAAPRVPRPPRRHIGRGVQHDIPLRRPPVAARHTPQLPRPPVLALVLRPDSIEPWRTRAAPDLVADAARALSDSPAQDHDRVRPTQIEDSQPIRGCRSPQVRNDQHRRAQLPSREAVERMSDGRHRDRAPALPPGLLA